MYRPRRLLWPTLMILPSLAAITGDPCLAKIDVAFAESESTGIAAFAEWTRRVASRSTLSSAYVARAATGNRPWASPVSAPMSWLGMPPISFARSSTDWTYQLAWLYAKIALLRFFAAPAACRYLAAVKIASTGLYGSAYPEPV